MRSCTLCFVPPLNIIICPISGCIARAWGLERANTIILHQPTTARCLYYVLRPILHVRISCLYLYCTAVSLCLPIFSYLHRHPHHRCCCLSSSNKQLRYHDVPDQPPRTYDDKFQKQHKRHELPQHFPVRLPVRTDSYPVIKSTQRHHQRGHRDPRSNQSRAFGTSTAVVACGVSGLCGLRRERRETVLVNLQSVRSIICPNLNIASPFAGRCMLEESSAPLSRQKGVFTTQVEENDEADLRCSFLRALSWLGSIRAERSHTLTSSLCLGFRSRPTGQSRRE